MNSGLPKSISNLKFSFIMTSSETYLLVPIHPYYGKCGL